MNAGDRVTVVFLLSADDDAREAMQKLADDPWIRTGTVVDGPPDLRVRLDSPTADDPSELTFVADLGHGLYEELDVGSPHAGPSALMLVTRQT